MGKGIAWILEGIAGLVVIIILLLMFILLTQRIVWYIRGITSAKALFKDIRESTIMFLGIVAVGIVMMGGVFLFVKLPHVDYIVCFIVGSVAGFMYGISLKK